MRSDILPGATLPDYELPDHTRTVRKLSEFQGDDPMILTLARGHYCPKEHQQHLELAAFYPKIAVGYARIVTISTDVHHTSQEFRASVGAQWPFLSDPDRIVQQDLEIQEYTDPENDPMIPHTLVLKPGLVIHRIYNGYWFWGRSDPSRLGPQRAGPAGALGPGRPRALPRLEQAAGGEAAPASDSAESEAMTATSSVAPAKPPALAGQTLLVIGGSAGIGLETARLARAEGADLILTARDPARLQQAGLLGISSTPAGSSSAPPCRSGASSARPTSPRSPARRSRPTRWNSRVFFASEDGRYNTGSGVCSAQPGRSQRIQSIDQCR